MRRPTLQPVYALPAAITVALGLASRRWPVLDKWPGDVLYAVLAVWCLRLIGVPRRASAVGGCLLATAVEVSKLWHVPWLDGLRATHLGGLVLGHGFLWADVACYAVGAALAGWLDASVAGRRSPPP